MLFRVSPADVLFLFCSSTPFYATASQETKLGTENKGHQLLKKMGK